MSTQKLRVLIFGAHPDDPDFSAGGVAALYARQGHTGKMISLTNGDAGPQREGGAPLAWRRRAEARLRAIGRRIPTRSRPPTTPGAGLSAVTNNYTSLATWGARIEPAKAIASYVAGRGDTILAMVTRRQSAMETAFLGSVTAGCLRQAGVPGLMRAP